MEYEIESSIRQKSLIATSFILMVFFRLNINIEIQLYDFFKNFIFFLNLLNNVQLRILLFK